MNSYVVSVAVILSITCTLSLGKGDHQSLSCAVQISPLSNCSLTIRDHCDLRICFAICPALEEGMCFLSGYCITYDSSVVDTGLCPYIPQNFVFFHKPLVSFNLVPFSLPLSKVNNFTCGAYNREVCCVANTNLGMVLLCTPLVHVCKVQQ